MGEHFMVLIDRLHVVARIHKISQNQSPGIIRHPRKRGGTSDPYRIIASESYKGSCISLDAPRYSDSRKGNPYNRNLEIKYYSGKCSD